MRRLFSLLLPAIALAASNAFASPDRAVTLDGAQPSGPHHVVSEVCKACHEDIYNQWAGSMHAQSTALKDPIHGAVYRSVMGDPLQEGLKSKKGTYPICLKCHAPAAAIDKKTKLDAAAAYNEGVNCVTCHLIKGYRGIRNAKGKLALGIDAYQLSQTHLQASSGKIYTQLATDPDKARPGLPVFHPFPMESNARMLKSNNLCLGCHNQRNNGHGVPVCITGPEYRDSGSFTTCQSCHMPVVNGVTSHAMMGGHHPEMVKKGLLMSIDAATNGDNIEATITVKNELPHAWPTGAPFRNMIITLTAYDEAGEQVWRSTQSHPMKDDPKAVFMYQLGGPDGKPSPPPKATQVLKDTRLMPLETRTLSYSIPAGKAKVLRAEALYNLLPPGMIKKLDAKLTPDLKEPKTAAVAELSL